MGKRNQKQNKAGYREINPTDAFRKYQRNKEKKRNKLERRKVREEAVLRKNPLKIKEELNKLRLQELRGELDFISRRKKQKLEDMWRIVKQKIDMAIKSKSTQIDVIFNPEDRLEQTEGTSNKMQDSVKGYDDASVSDDGSADSSDSDSSESSDESDDSDDSSDDSKRNSTSGTSQTVISSHDNNELDFPPPLPPVSNEFLEMMNAGDLGGASHVIPCIPPPPPPIPLSMQEFLYGKATGQNFDITTNSHLNFSERLVNDDASSADMRNTIMPPFHMQNSMQNLKSGELDMRNPPPLPRGLPPMHFDGNYAPSYTYMNNYGILKNNSTDISSASNIVLQLQNNTTNAVSNNYSVQQFSKKGLNKCDKNQNSIDGNSKRKPENLSGIEPPAKCSHIALFVPTQLRIQKNNSGGTANGGGGSNLASSRRISSIRQVTAFSTGVGRLRRGAIPNTESGKELGGTTATVTGSSSGSYSQKSVHGASPTATVAMAHANANALTVAAFLRDTATPSKSLISRSTTSSSRPDIDQVFNEFLKEVQEA